MNRFRLPKIILAVLLLVLGNSASAAVTGDDGKALVSDVQVTILSSNLANGAAVGEWGLSALVEADGNCVLFDAGRFPDTVIRNANVLDVDLSCVTDVVFSHFHFDHTTGLIPIIEYLNDANSNSVTRVHVAKGFFSERRANAGSSIRANQMIQERSEIEALGVQFVVHEEAAEIYPGIWISGPIERRYPETNYGTAIEVSYLGRWMRDYLPESQALVIRTEDGPIVLLGCGHSGVVNALSQIQDQIQDEAIHALMGGLHLFNASDEILQWTGEMLKEIGVQNLMAGHCTGIEPLVRLRAGLELTRRTAVVGAVGSRFVLGEGIHPTAIAM